MLPLTITRYRDPSNERICRQCWQRENNRKKKELSKTSGTGCERCGGTILKRPIISSGSAPQKRNVSAIALICKKCLRKELPVLRVDGFKPFESIALDSASTMKRPDSGNLCQPEEISPGLYSESVNSCCTLLHNTNNLGVNLGVSGEEMAIFGGTRHRLKDAHHYVEVAEDIGAEISSVSTLHAAESSTKRPQKKKYKIKILIRNCKTCSTEGTSRSRQWYRDEGGGFICNTCYTRKSRKEKLAKESSILGADASPLVVVGLNHLLA